MPVAGDSLTAIVLQSGKVFFAPGLLGPGGDPPAVVTTTAAELYDPLSESWSVIGGLIQPSGSATLLASGAVLVVSGHVEVVQIYDPATGAWRRTGAATTIRESHTATLLHSGKVLVVGGTAGPSSAELYNPATGTWTPTSPMTARHREGADATLLALGTVLVAGGGTGSPGAQATDSVDLYDPATAKWTASGVMAAARTFFTGTLLPSGAMLFAGGLGVDLRPTSSVEIYPPTCV